MLAIAIAAALQIQQPTIIPKPASMQVRPGLFVIQSTTQIKDEHNTFAARLLQDLLSKGAHLRLGKTKNLRLPGIDFEPEPGPTESHSLSVGTDGIRIGYADP